MKEHLSAWIKISWERSRNFALNQDKKLYIFLVMTVASK